MTLIDPLSPFNIYFEPLEQLAPLVPLEPPYPLWSAFVLLDLFDPFHLVRFLYSEPRSSVKCNNEISSLSSTVSKYDWNTHKSDTNISGKYNKFSDHKSEHYMLMKSLWQDNEKLRRQIM